MTGTKASPLRTQCLNMFVMGARVSSLTANQCCWGECG
jgi:hypothetical protein